MNQGTGEIRRVLPRAVPAGAVAVATLELSSPLGLAWRERLWLVRCRGRDSLWAAVAETPERAVPVVAADSAGTPAEAAGRLLGGYLAETRAELQAASPASTLLPAEHLAALLALRRGRIRH